nr:MAG TPA: hypothetical protein [Bacteriophage sp.]
MLVFLILDYIVYRVLRTNVLCFGVDFMVTYKRWMPP